MTVGGGGGSGGGGGGLAVGLSENKIGHVMTLANSIIGVAILAMPFCFQKVNQFTLRKYKMKPFTCF